MRRKSRLIWHISLLLVLNVSCKNEKFSLKIFKLTFNLSISEAKAIGFNQLYGEDVALFLLETDSVVYRCAFDFNQKIGAQYWVFPNKAKAMEYINKLNFGIVNDECQDVRGRVYFYDRKTSFIYYGGYERSDDSTYVIGFNTPSEL